MEFENSQNKNLYHSNRTTKVKNPVLKSEQSPYTPLKFDNP